MYVHERSLDTMRMRLNASSIRHQSQYMSAKPFRGIYIQYNTCTHTYTRTNERTTTSTAAGYINDDMAERKRARIARKRVRTYVCMHELYACVLCMYCAPIIYVCLHRNQHIVAFVAVRSIHRLAWTNCYNEKVRM